MRQELGQRLLSRQIATEVLDQQCYDVIPSHQVFVDPSLSAVAFLGEIPSYCLLTTRDRPPSAQKCPELQDLTCRQRWQ